MTDAIPTDWKKLARIFKNRSIPVEEIGFYNHPHFVAAERENPTFLEFYAAWVRARPRDTVYNEHARRVVPLIAGVVAEEIDRDNQLGVCADASMMLTKMLEEEGIWCYAISGSLCIRHPSLGSDTSFYMIDVGRLPGHVWVVAPPFEVIDVALRKQPYTRGEADLLPRFLAVEGRPEFIPSVSDHCSPEVMELEFARRGFIPGDLHFQLRPGLERVASFFPSLDVRVGDTELRYMPAGITMSDAPSLSAITSRTWNRRLAGELYEQLVKPALRDE